MPENNIREVIDEMRQELTDYLKIKGVLLQLQIAEKGTPLLAKGVHSGLLLVLLIIDLGLVLATLVFALSLLFIGDSLEGFTILRGLILGTLCVLGILTIITLIIAILKKKMTAKIEQQCLSKVLDYQESQEERELQPQIKEKTVPPHLARKSEDLHTYHQGATSHE